MGQSIKVQSSPKAPVVVLSFHQDVAKIAMHGIRQAQTVADKMRALLIEHYGEPTLAADAEGFGEPGAAGGPSFKQYKADLKALDAIAKQRKLESGQWLRRPYGAALKALYGALPVSDDPAAVAKRVQREAAEAQVKAALEAAKTAAGAPKGETQEREPSETEKLESLVARLGVFETLAACIHILEADEATKGQALHMRKMAEKAEHEAEKAKRAAQPANV